MKDLLKPLLVDAVKKSAQDALDKVKIEFTQEELDSIVNEAIAELTQGEQPSEPEF